MPRYLSLGWSGVLIATVFMMLASGLILYPKTTHENILTALRLSSVTTAIPFLLVFIAKPLTVMASDLGRWVQSNRQARTQTLLHGIGVWYIWLVFTLVFGLGFVARHIRFYNTCH